MDHSHVLDIELLKGPQIMLNMMAVTFKQFCTIVEVTETFNIFLSANFDISLMYCIKNYFK